MNSICLIVRLSVLLTFLKFVDCVIFGKMSFVKLLQAEKVIFPLEKMIGLSLLEVPLNLVIFLMSEHEFSTKGMNVVIVFISIILHRFC
jgi:hypothetical protein